MLTVYMQINYATLVIDSNYVIPIWASDIELQAMASFLHCNILLYSGGVWLKFSPHQYAT